MIRSKILMFFIVTFGVFFLSISPSLAKNKPNVVVMMVDNLGWGELGVYGGGELRGAPTPRLDKLAEEGMRLLNFNVEPQCTPTQKAAPAEEHVIRRGCKNYKSDAQSCVQNCKTHSREKLL